MSNFTVEIHNAETSSSETVDVMWSGGAYTVNINEVYKGTLIQDKEAPYRYVTTDEELAPYAEKIAEVLTSQKNKVSVKELFGATVGIIQLIAFLFGTVVTFKLKELIKKTKMGALVNFLPAFIQLIGGEQITSTGL